MDPGGSEDESIEVSWSPVDRSVEEQVVNP